MDNILCVRVRVCITNILIRGWSRCAQGRLWKAPARLGWMFMFWQGMRAATELPRCWHVIHACSIVSILHITFILFILFRIILILIISGYYLFLYVKDYFPNFRIFVALCMYYCSILLWFVPILTLPISQDHHHSKLPWRGTSRQERNTNYRHCYGQRRQPLHPGWPRGDAVVISPLFCTHHHSCYYNQYFGAIISP